MIRYRLNSDLYVGKLGDFNFNIQYKSDNKILILTSKSIAKINIVKLFINNMLKNNEVFIKLIKPEAPVQDLDDIVLNTPKPNIILAIGGGSVLDSSKAISLGWQGITIEDFLYNKKQIPASKIHLISLPTTAGTGSELSFGAILSDKKNRFKNGIRSPLISSDVVIIDRDLYLNANRRIKSESGFDCLSHAIETYLSKKSSSFIKMRSVSCISQIFSSLENAVDGDEISMESIAISSSMMGVNLAYSTTCLPHRMQYILGPYTNSRHAEGIISLYKGWIRQITPFNEFQELASALGLTSIQLAKKINSLKDNLKINYSLKDFNVDEKLINLMTQKVSGTLDLDPCYKSKDTIKEIFYNSL